MLVEIAIAAAAVVGAGAGWAFRARVRERKPAGEHKRREPASRGLAINDVLLVDGAEYWLSGLITLADEPVPLSLFSAPHRGSHAWIMDAERPLDPPVLLHPESRWAAMGRAPDALELDGAHYRVVRRASARATCFGEAPTLSARVRFTLYRAGEDALALILETDEHETIALVGARLREGAYDRLPGKA